MCRLSRNQVCLVTTATPGLGVLAPKNTPHSIVDRLGAEMNKIAKEPDFRAKLASVGMSVVEDTPEQFADYMKEDVGEMEEGYRNRRY